MQFIDIVSILGNVFLAPSNQINPAGYHGRMMKPEVKYLHSSVQGLEYEHSGINEPV